MSAIQANVSAVPTSGPKDPYRVLIVDDSAVVRMMLSRWLDAETGISVVGMASNGRMAVDAVRRLKPEIVLLDIEMPEMTGLEALPELLRAVPDLKVIMASTLTHQGAEVSLKALRAGAADYIAKPQSNVAGNSDEFKRDIFAKVKALGAALRLGRRNLTRRPAGAVDSAPPEASEKDKPRTVSQSKIALRSPTGVRPRIMMIGASTGGPQALLQVFSEWQTAPGIPILITQHMPSTFTAILAKHIAHVSGLICKEVEDEEPLVPGRIYLARGGYHAIVDGTAKQPIVRLDDGPAENFCRPSVDPMLRAGARVFKAEALGVLLTGMGRDGLAGARNIVDAGGTIFAQDQRTSVVWGMPGAVATAGLCTQIIPLDEVAAVLQKAVSGERT